MAQKSAGRPSANAKPQGRGRRRQPNTTPPVERAPAAAAAKIRVAIVGGGCAGMAAAWWLSKNAAYEVSVFERSDRLGGKGASVRAPDGRILEHGLHVWLGFYDNAFAMIRECYAEVEKRKWGPHAAKREHRLPHATFNDAFYTEPHIGVAGRVADDDVVWSGLLPPEEGLPGDPIDVATNPFTLANYLLRCAHLLKALMLSVVANPNEDVPGGTRPGRRSALDEQIDLDFSIDPTQSPEVLIENVTTQVRNGSLTLAAALLQAVKILENVVQDFSHSPQAAGSVLNVLRALTSQAAKQLSDIVAIDERLRWKTEIIDIVMTIAVGLYRDRVLLSRKGLDALNDIDYRDWLRRHGATETSLASRFITGIYDLVFAYADGERSKPRLAAGVALRGALRMFFTYRGSMFWRMRSGMGDAVFAPLYKVLTARDRKDARSGRPITPVQFYFQHALRRVRFDVSDPKSRYVVALEFAKPSDAAPESPLDRFGCWRPSQTVRATKRARTPASATLKIGEHFDAVIFAMGRDDFEAIVTDSSAGLARETMPKPWQRALQQRNQTVATKAAQVWFASDLEELGWYRGSAIVAGLDLPFQTWADMTHTIPSERAWAKTHARGGRVPPASTAASVAYFCGVLSERDIKQDQHQPRTLRDQLGATLDGMTTLWPTTSSDRTRLQPLADHVQANVTGSDRYSLSLPGTIRDRLSPLDMSFRNLTVAGDWTACGLDAGCVEAAVMSGMLAAHAISTEPRLENIIGFDHP